MGYLIQILHDVAPDGYALEQAWKHTDRPTRSWLETRMRAVDRGHMLAGWPEPFSRMKAEEKAFWRLLKRNVLRESAQKGADALELPEVIRLLAHLAEPPDTHVRDAAWLVACDPRVVDERGRRMPWSFWASVEANDVRRFGDGHAEVVGRSYGQQRVVHVPAGWAADLLWAAVQTRQPAYRADDGFVLDGDGVPLLRRQDYSGPLWTRDDKAATDGGLVPLLHPEEVARRLLEGRGLLTADEVAVARTPLGRGHLLTFDPEVLEGLTARVGGPSWASIEDAAWAGSAFWMFARGMEILDRHWDDAMISPKGVYWYLTRKTDPTGRTPWYGVRHVRFPVLDPGWLLERHRRVLLHRRHRAGLPTPTGPEDYRDIPLFPNRTDLTVPVTDTGSLNERLKQYAKVLGFPQQRVTTHSMRIGAATSASQCGIAQQEIMVAGGWADPEMAQRYHRAGAAMSGRSAAIQMQELAGLSAPGSDATFSARVDEAVAQVAAKHPACTCDVCAADAQRVLAESDTTDRQRRRTM